MEQRYHAVMEVISGPPVTEVAGRYGVTRQAVHVWLGKYQKEGLAGLADHSHRPHFQPRQLAADVVGRTADPASRGYAGPSRRHRRSSSRWRAAGAPR